MRAQHNGFKRGFALPTVLIASVILLTVLAVAVSATAAVRTTLKNQYYEQLAQTAGEAGVAYAKACLAANGNVPLWSEVAPLTPATDCTGTALSGVSCPSDSRCFITVNGNVRSSFRVGLPSLDSAGNAVKIPNNGYVEIIRASNGSVWRTYTQPNVQSVVVPDLCSGATSSTQGWVAVEHSTSSVSGFTPTTQAQTITIADGFLNFGATFYRKDFSITSAGTYNIAVKAGGTVDEALIYVDGKYVATSFDGALATGSLSLNAGCHNVFVRLLNTGISIPNNEARFKASVIKNGASIPTVVSDRSWRATAGGTVNFAHKDYYVDPGTWGVVRDIQTAVSINSAWTATSGDSGARWISTTHNLSGSNYPAAQYTFLRDSRQITVASSTSVRITYNCDDSCDIYLDGNKIAGGVYNNVFSTTVTLSEGVHQLGVILYNGTASPAGAAVSAVRISDSAVLSRTDASWLAVGYWQASNTPPYSYDNSHVPTPNTEAVATVRALVVGGGGGGGNNHGGGGGGGGVVYNTSIPVQVSIPYAIVVGAGGAGGTSGTVAGGVGGYSRFGNYLGLGGGGGGGRIATDSVSQSVMGGSGGGGAGTEDGAVVGTGGPGALGTINQGNQGGNGSSGTTAGNGGGGGGAGVAGGNATGTATATGVSGTGGNGIQNSITGSSVYYGGGGSGGRWGAGSVGAAGLGGGGLGGNNNSVVGAAGTANTGGGGGGGGASVANGGAGGSGVVIISYLTGTMTATGGTITTSGGYTIHRFTTSGTFTVSDIPAPATLGVNAAPPFSAWSLSGGATYNSGTGEVTLPTSSAVVSSPIIRVNATGVMYAGADFLATGSAVNWTPLGGFYVQTNYFALDGVTQVSNSLGQTANGCAKSLTLNTYVTNTDQCGAWAGPNIKYMNFSFNGGDWASPGIKIKNPSIIFN
jgi:hypothetical protein